MKNFLFQFVGVSAVAVLALACGGSADPNNGAQDTSADEHALTRYECAPIATLDCGPGYVVTTDGCPSRILQQPRGRCERDKSDTDDAGAAACNLDCAIGYHCEWRGIMPIPRQVCVRD